ncbi:hypothetical protein B484DRAFT_461312, partial [Ochromonadaceae sp. CCMP2298]
MLKIKAGSMSALKSKMQRALAGQHEEVDTKILVKGACSGIEFSAQLPHIKARFQQEENSWKLIDDAEEPPPPPAGIQAGEDPTQENSFDEPAIDVDNAVQARLTEMEDAVNTAFDAQIAAIPPTAPAPPPGGGAAWTAANVATRTAEINAQRAVALLNANMKLDDLRQQNETREFNRRRRKKSFSERQQACGKVFTEVFATEILSPWMQALTSHRYRFVFRRLCSSLDGTLGGTDTTISVINEINSYVYCSELSMDDNIQYLNHLCTAANYADSYRLVCLLGAIDRSPSVHREIRETASLHRRIASTYPVLVQALRTAYSILINTGKITQGVKSHKEHASVTAAAALAQGGGNPTGGKRRNTQGDRLDKNKGNNGPGPHRQGKLTKTKDDRHCSTCNKSGHTAADCWQTHPCGQCGSKTH